MLPSYVVKYTRDFVLTITFNSTGGTLEGVIQELDDLKINNPNQVRIEDYLAYERDFILSEATFDTNGVITGKTVFKSSNIGGLNFGRIIELPGTLTGLIGQEGAVAVFNNGNISTKVLATLAGLLFSQMCVAQSPMPIGCGRMPLPLQKQTVLVKMM